MKIVFGRDTFLGGDLLSIDYNNFSESIITHPDFYDSDVRILNLEQSVSDSPFIAKKSTLYTNSAALGIIKNLKITAVNIAHNHIHDKGPDGIIDTRYHLENQNIGCFGAGKSLDDATKAYWVTSALAVLGYCDFDKPYLKNVAVASRFQPGVSPSRHDKIFSDLNNLKDNQKAILYFHWGREHVPLPPLEDIRLAEKLLEDPRVLLIIGMHAHRPQGIISKQRKKAYMCIGNFLFPNFYISPPVQLISSNKNTLSTHWKTRNYHKVKALTYKKWKFLNRVSFLIVYDTDTSVAKHKFALQHDSRPIICKPTFLIHALMKFCIFLLSLLYILPDKIYNILEGFVSTVIMFQLKIKYKLFLARQAVTEGKPWK